MIKVVSFNFRKVTKLRLLLSLNFRYALQYKLQVMPGKEGISFGAKSVNCLFIRNNDFIALLRGPDLSFSKRAENPTTTILI